MTSSHAAATHAGPQLAHPPASAPLRPPLPSIPPAADPDPMSAGGVAAAAAPATTITTSPSAPDSTAPMPLSDHPPHGFCDDPHEVQSVPSPPTVSPLSTPAATHVNIDDDEDRHVPGVSAESVPATNGATEPSSTAQPASASLKAAGEVFAGKLEPARAPGQSARPRNQVEAIATTDPDPANIDYSTRPLAGTMRQAQATVDPNLYMMNLAQATSALFQNPGPSIVAPSEVSLQASFTQESDALTTTADRTSTSLSQKLESFARIEFADSVFQMTTYAVVIGRDQRAMDQARRDEKRELNYRRRVEENARNGLPPPTPLNFDRGKFSKSYVSEEGGMLGPESDGEDNVRPAKKRRPSSGSRSHDGDEDAQSDHVKSNRQYVSHTPGAAAVDLGTLQPSPSHVPFVGIHSPGPDIASKTRGISRRHLKIEFNEKKGVFEAIALHKNGFFCEDAHYGLDGPVTLRSGDRLQIKDVEFTFIINGVQPGQTGGEEEYHEEETSSKRMSIGGKEMSFDFEHSDHENFQDTSEELSEIENVPTPAIVSDDEDDEGDNEAAVVRSDAGDEPKTAAAQPTEAPPGVLQPEFTAPEIPKRRGPGRPPKDGIMSKRERRLLKKQMQETSKKTIPQEPQGEKIKRPVGRPRKNPLPEDGEKPEKRKYNKRKPKEEGEEGSEAEKRAREKKEKKARPKSPPLELRKEDFTEEQLQKPTKNYGVLIDEALTNGPPDGLTLKQIYKRIMSRYPWFYFSAETKGWESSVRHNLIGNEAFKKAEGTGLWSRVPGVELDAGKKRKASSPDRQLGSAHLLNAQQQYYQNGGSYLPTNALGFTPGMPNYATSTKQPQTGFQPATSQPALAHTTTVTQPTTQQVYPAQAQVPAPAQLPLGYLSRQPSNAQQSTYNSPYAKLPPQNSPPIKSEVPAVPSPQVSPAAPVQVPAASSLSPNHHLPPSNTLHPNTTSRSPLSPEIEKAIAHFRSSMLNVLTKQTNHAAQIVDSAIGRVRGLPVQGVPVGFESIEKSLTNAIENMVSEMRPKQQPQATSASPAPVTSTVAGPTPTPSMPASNPAPTPTLAMEAEIQRRIASFRRTMLLALREKTDQAEAIIDSAISRAQGLSNTGLFQGWEEADRLMARSVVQIIADARSSYGASAQPTTPTSATTSQPIHPSHTAQLPGQAPSASPAPAHAPTSATRLGQTNPNTVAPTPNPHSPPAPVTTPRPTPPSASRPGISIQRPSPMGLTRPGVNSIARPPVVRRGSAITPTLPGPSAPPPMHNISNPAPPSAGVMDQIAGQKRLHDDGYSTSNGGVLHSEVAGKALAPAAMPNISSAAPPSEGVISQIGQRRLYEGSLNGNGGQHHQQPPEPTPRAMPPTAPPSICSPAPPSAGVVDQIAGQKRPLDEGPGGSGNGSEQPEAKKIAISPA
ncbi:hypothetical protein GGS23DRAFT_157574 [Durotheca rogersii]|uniref:uncharacterized protein n=1 Tax=Durotheca rogersii TaxID=419775 RepID=UPI00221F2E9E|nr:uncharacterized protein GGS23DRAFT_157574 [Durotheca rogersii]KAI5861194.1 hypothetical protein GGS23DRAFT_157574 [Durotheca rogersii]